MLSKVIFELDFLTVNLLVALPEFVKLDPPTITCIVYVCIFEGAI